MAHIRVEGWERAIAVHKMEAERLDGGSYREVPEADMMWWLVALIGGVVAVVACMSWMLAGAGGVAQ